jgi:snapalysin
MRSFSRALAVAAALALGATGVQITHASAAAAPRTLYYDASRAAEFKAAVDEAAKSWNSSVKAIKLVPRTPAPITINAYDGWPYASPRGFGAGSIYMGREAVDDGFYPPRIAAHELGHILGLPDNRTGLCSDLMSGHSSPTSCKSTTPSPKEAAQVEKNATRGVAQVRLPATIYEVPAGR